MKDCKIYTAGRYEEICKKLVELGASMPTYQNVSDFDKPFIFVKANVVTSGLDVRYFVNFDAPEITVDELLAMKTVSTYRFKTGEKVLVRDHDGEEWRFNIYSHKADDSMHVCVYGKWLQCIPYNYPNRSLVGTK